MDDERNGKLENCIKEKETGVMKNGRLQAMFDVIVEKFDPSDVISVKNTNYEMSKRWRIFLEAGADINLTVKMMSIDDIWENYDELLARGAELDVAELFSTHKEFFDKDFSMECCDWLIDHGVSKNLILDRFADCNINDLSSLKFFLKIGVDAKKAFGQFKDWLAMEQPGDQIWSLNLLYEYGLPKADITAWLDKNMSIRMEEYMVENESGLNFYEEFGTDDDDYDIIDRWIERNDGRHYLDGHSLSKLPGAISVDAFLAHISIYKIIEESSQYSGGFKAFITDCINNGGDIDMLAKRLMDNVNNHPSDSSELGAMFDLVHAGASADIIPAKYIEEVGAIGLPV